MTAKEYLTETLKLRHAARALADKAEMLRTEIAGVKAITYDKERIQTSPENRVEDLMIRLIEIEERYKETLRRYYAGILIREKQIAEIGRNDYEEILRMRYIETDEKGRRLSLEEIAVKTHRSFDRIRHLHGEALAEFTRRYL